MAYVRRPMGVGTLAYPFYSGKSGDVKPTPSEENATAYEEDTRRTYFWRDGEWILRDGPAAATDSPETLLLRELVREVRALRLGMIEARACVDVNPGDVAEPTA